MQRRLRKTVFISSVAVQSVQESAVKLAIHHIPLKSLSTKMTFGQSLDVYIKFEQAMEQLTLAVK